MASISKFIHNSLEIQGGNVLTSGQGAKDAFSVPGINTLSHKDHETIKDMLA